MRKTISTILVLVMVLSVFTSFGANAEHWAQPSIDFVVQNGYWIASEPINPDKIATRAETASLFARVLISKIPAYDGAYADVTADNIYSGDITAAKVLGLMVGNNGYFRPYDTLTREELACILDRASKMVSDEFVDTSWNMEFYKDGDDVSGWASQSVQNATKYVLMKGKGAKLFDPKGTVTIGEVATVVTTLADIADNAKQTSSATVRDITSSDNIQRDFDVIQSGGINEALGIAGFGMMVRFDGAPGDIYVSRKTSSRTAPSGLADNKLVVKVIGPDGNTIVRENMYYKEDGLMEKIISIPNGEAGIYRIIFTSGKNQDIMTIGVKDPVSWGVYGEDTFIYTESTPKQGYIYVPEKTSSISVGIGSKGAAKAILWNEAKNARILETAESDKGIQNTYRMRADAVGVKEGVYILEVPDSFRGVIGIEGCPKIICPTAEMARDLKGGIIYYEDEYASLQLSGPLQVRARQKMVEIYEEMNGDFTVPFTKPAWNDNLDNPQAEMQLHSAYFHSITNLKHTWESQVLDPTNPYFGQFAPLAMIRGEEAWPTKNWQHYEATAVVPGEKYMVGALTINAETNAFYANPVLQKRVELEYLAWAVRADETYQQIMQSAAGNGAQEYSHGAETFLLGDHSALTHGYGEARNFLDPEVRAICDEAIWGWCEVSMMARGQGPTNQAVMGLVAAIDAYKATGWQHFIDDFEDKFLGLCYPSSLPNYIGQTSPLGFWQESGGSDGGSYGRMSEGMVDVCVMEYFTMDEKLQKPEVVAEMRKAIDRFLIFDGLFYTSAINGFSGYSTAAFTSRQPASYGGFSAIPGTTYLINYFPRALRYHYECIFDDENPMEYDIVSATAGYIVGNDKTAYTTLKEFWEYYEDIPASRYASKKEESYKAVSSWRMYRAFHVPKAFTAKELPYIPYEMPGDYNIYDPEGGAIAIKHKGLYMMSYYDNNLTVQSGYSWLSSGPSIIWDEYFATLSTSEKPATETTKNSGNHYRDDPARSDPRGKFLETELYLTGVLGLDSAGQVWSEGKEIDKKFSWIEEGKSFEISGTHPFSGDRVTWRYFMTDEGIELEAGLDKVVPGSELYVQIPLTEVSKFNDTASLTYDGVAGKVVFAHEGKSTTISWDPSVESKFEAKAGEEGRYRYLKLRITPEKPMVRFKFTREMADYVYIPWIDRYRDAKF